jgi:putative spermidine/putrescine transport system ATP-binding protein
MTQTAQSLTLEDISVDYGRGPVVANFSVHVEPGKILALLGQSGCGKSTILRVIAGLLTPSAGSVHFGATDMTLRPPWERNLGLMFQSHALFPHLTVLRNVEYGLRPKKMAKKDSERRALEMLELVHMTRYANVHPTELSGGQSQRVALARALAPAPRVLLLDEPFSSLDAGLRERMRAEVAAIVRQVGVTTVFVTHDQDEALSIADMIAVMSAGNIVELASPRDIYKRPRHAYTAAFVGGSNLIKGELCAANGAWRFKAGDTELAIGEANLAAGPAMLAIKPEDVAVDPPPECQHRFRARLEEASFHGPNQRLVWLVESLDGKAIVSRTVNSQRDFRVGDTHEIGWKSSDAVVVEMDQ